MMNFEEHEIAELQEARDELPVYTLDANKTKKAKREREMSAKKSNSAMSNSNQSCERTSGHNGSQEGRAKQSLYYSKNADSPEKAVKDKLKSNLLGLFRREPSSQKSPAATSARPTTASNVFEIKQSSEGGHSFNKKSTKPIFDAQIARVAHPGAPRSEKSAQEYSGER